MRGSGAGLVLMAVMISAAAHAQSEDPPPVGGIAVAGQIGTGIVGTVVGYFGGGLATRSVARKLGAEPDAAARVANIGGIVSGVLLTATGPTLIGSRGLAHGKYTAAVGGAVAGGVVADLLRRFGKTGALGERGPVAIVAGAMIVALPSIGATVAFNESRRR